MHQRTVLVSAAVPAERCHLTSSTATQHLVVIDVLSLT